MSTAPAKTEANNTKGTVMNSNDNNEKDTVMNNTEMSGYAFAKKVNEVLAKNGIEKTIKPQMIYNYVRKGYITANEKNLIEYSEFERFATKYVSKQLAMQMTVSVEL